MNRRLKKSKVKLRKVGKAKIPEAALACSLAGHGSFCRFRKVCGCWCHE